MMGMPSSIRFDGQRPRGRGLPPCSGTLGRPRSINTSPATVPRTGIGDHFPRRRLTLIRCEPRPRYTLGRHLPSVNP
jgi:hypothetical protein